jgi:hypothetical protein
VILSRAVQSGYQYAIESKSSGESVFCRLEVDVARTGLKRISHQQIDETNHRRLCGQVANIRLNVLLTVRSLELHVVCESHNLPFDQAFQFLEGCFIDLDFTPIQEYEIV